jgi:hypothetical protein
MLKKFWQILMRVNIYAVGLGALLVGLGLVSNYFLERQNFGDWTALLASAFAFFLTVAGIVSGVAGVARCRPVQVLLLAVAISLPLAICFGFCYFIIQSVQTGADRLGECPALEKAAAATNVVPDSVVRWGRPAVDCAVERRGMWLEFYNRIEVYGVRDPSAQQAILDSLSSRYRAAHTHPLQIMFYEKDNWVLKSGTARAGLWVSGPRKLIRVVRIG